MNSLLKFTDESQKTLIHVGISELEDLVTVQISFWTHFFSLYFIIKIVCVPWNVGPVQPWKWSAGSQPWGLWWTREFTVNVYKQTRSPAMVHLAWLVLLLGKESFWRIYGWSWWPQLQLCKSQAGGEQEGLKTWWAATRFGIVTLGQNLCNLTSFMTFAPQLSWN